MIRDEDCKDPGTEVALPAWLSALVLLCAAVQMAGIFGGPLTKSVLTLLTACAFVASAALLGWRWQLAQRSARPRLRPGLHAGAVVGSVVVFGAGALLLKQVLSPGAPVSYTAQFLWAAMIFGVAMMIERDTFSFPP